MKMNNGIKTANETHRYRIVILKTLKTPYTMKCANYVVYIRHYSGIDSGIYHYMGELASNVDTLTRLSNTR